MNLSQANVALFRWPTGDVRMREFVARIESTNRLAESSPGFVWRYQGEYDPAGRLPPFDDPLLFFNMSVWRDAESLQHFVFRTEHAELLKRKDEWTRPAPVRPLVTWQIEDGSRPSVDEAIARLLAP